VSVVENPGKQPLSAQIQNDSVKTLAVVVIGSSHRAICTN
jgi:hypothetical protein